MTETEYKGIEVVPTTREEVTRLNANTQRIEFDRDRFRRYAELNRERYIQYVKTCRRKVASRERD